MDYLALLLDGVHPAFAVFIYALLTAIATGLGALPFLLMKKVKVKWMGIGDAFAGGLMLTASFQLINEGISYNIYQVVIGIIMGLVLISLSRSFLDNRYDNKTSEESYKQLYSLKSLMLIGVMTAHSFAEGVSVGVSFGDGMEFGSYISAAIALHNIPEGLAISAVLVSQGESIWKAMWWSIFSSLPQPILAVPSFLFVESFEDFLPLGLGFAAGAMIWMFVSELLPDSLENVSKQKASISVIVGIVIMLLLQSLL